MRHYDTEWAGGVVTVWCDDGVVTVWCGDSDVSEEGWGLGGIGGVGMGWVSWFGVVLWGVVPYEDECVMR